MFDHRNIPVLNIERFLVIHQYREYIANLAGPVRQFNKAPVANYQLTFHCTLLFVFERDQVRFTGVRVCRKAQLRNLEYA